MSKVIVQKVYGYGEGDSRVVISNDMIERGYFFGRTQSYLVDKKIDTEDYLNTIEDEGSNFSAKDYFDEHGINYYGLYTDTRDCEYNNLCPYVSDEEIEELEKEYPYYFDLDGNNAEVYENKGVLINFEEVTYFTSHENNLKTIEIKEEYEKLELIEACIVGESTYQLDLYKNEKGEYVVAYNSYYAGSYDTIEDYDISAEELEEQYDYCIEE